MNQDPNAGAAGQPDYDKPVAYDTEGRPLYLRPADGAPQVEATAGKLSVAAAGPNPQSHGNHQYVHVSRPISPHDPEIPPAIMKRYEESSRTYPQLNLSRGEFIISAVTRHPIGLFQIWFIAILLIAVLGFVIMNYLAGGNSSAETVMLATAGLGIVTVLVFLGAFVASYIYNNNRFYLTNESVIQEIQASLFSKHEQTVSLANIEDASYRQDGILPQMLNYGLIRLSTEGDETTYRFNYVSDPKKQIAILNNAVEAFKNGRPVIPTDEN